MEKVKPMHLQKIFPGLLVLVLMLAMVAGCEAAEITAIELVPQNANLIAEVQVSKIINDPDLRSAYEEAEKGPGEPQTVEAAMDELVEESGIDLGDFHRAVIFADITEMDGAGYVGVIAEGTFDEEQFIDNLKRKAGEQYTASDFRGYKLYTDEGGESAFIFLSDTVLLSGTTEAVKDAIRVVEGDKEPVSGVILDTYNQLGDVLIKFAFELPEEARKAILEEPAPEDIPISFESFADIDILGFVLNKEGETISVHINSHFLSTDSAEDAYNTLSGAILLYKGMAPDPKIKDLLSKINVSVVDDSVEIVFETTLSEIEKMIEEFR